MPNYRFNRQWWMSFGMVKMVPVGWLQVHRSLPSRLLNTSHFLRPNFYSYPNAFSLSSCSFPLPFSPRVSHISLSKRRKSSFEPVLKQVTSQEVVEEEETEINIEGVVEDDDAADGFEDDMLMDDDEDFEDGFEVEDADPYVGDGGGGGGVSFAGTWWDKEALALAEEVSASFDGDLRLYSFKTSANAAIRVRVEKLSSKYGSPGMIDIQAFSSAYRARLDEAERVGTIPENTFLEVSSPGVERMVRIPDDLERFKDRPMYVKYVNEVSETASFQEGDGVFRLISYDLDLGCCIWGLADVRMNRERAGKGRPLSKKQREWRMQTPFESLRLVRVHSEF